MLHLRATLTPIEFGDVDVVVTTKARKGTTKGLVVEEHHEPRDTSWTLYAAPQNWTPRYVVRARGGHWTPNGSEDHVRRQWYRTGLAVADQLQARSIGFATGPHDPGIWPLDEWVNLALSVVRGTPTHVNVVEFC